MRPVVGSRAKRLEQGGRLQFNLLHFGRLLRKAGMAVGPAHLLDAVETVSSVGVHRREDVFVALHAAFVKRREDEALFREAFDLFWQDPYGRADTLSLLLPHTSVPEDELRDPMTRRLMEAYRRPPPDRAPEEPPPAEVETVDATLTYSELQSLKNRDFEQMSADELRRALELVRRMRFDHFEVPSRRRKPTEHGDRLDPRRMMRASLRTGGHDLPLRFTGPRTRPPPLVVLADISGSMDRYARVFLHFAHALRRRIPRLCCFVFGTELWNITRTLRDRDVDQALARVGAQVKDWSGGTRIASTLHAFNQRWARRVLGDNAVVLLMTDGLDRSRSLHQPLDPRASELGHEAKRLGLASHRLIWLNPLLRFEGFEPAATGVKAILPHVDEHRPVHDLSSLEQLVRALTAPANQARRSAG